MFSLFKRKPDLNIEIAKSFIPFEKVYYINEWPNNGFGLYLKYLERSKKFLIAERGTGNIIKVNKVKHLAEAIEDKKRHIKDMGYPNRLSANLDAIYWGNVNEIYEGEKYLNE